MLNEIYPSDLSDKRFYGIYRGLVVDINDPDKLNRIKLQVPQILGNAVTNWAFPIIGVPENKKVPYGSFYDYTDQYPGNINATSTAAAVINTPSPMRISKTDKTSTQFVYVDGPHTSQITFQKAGIYNFQWSGQFQNDSNSEQDVSIWLRQNGVDLDGSTGLISIPARHNISVPGHSIVGWNYLINAAAGDYIELWWTADNVNVTLQAYANNTTVPYPSTASVVATVDLIGGFLPLPGDGCWVMFEGGDPNFPLWLGAF